jgi:ribosomal-protein-alanine N-acetyltransferase
LGIIRATQIQLNGKIRPVDLPDEMPVLATPQVTLRRFTEDDVGLVAEASSDPLIPLITSVPTTPGTPEALAYIERQWSRLPGGQGYSFAIARTDTGAAVGQIGLWLRDIRHGRASVGYWTVASARRRGYAGAALAALSSWGLTLAPIHRLELYAEPWNEGSWRAAEQAGYEREGLLRSWAAVGLERRDMYVYSRLRPRLV